MSEVLAQLEKKGGGGLDKTVLWSLPSSQTTFGDETLTLSDDINNYSYIGFHYYGRILGGNKEYDVLASVESLNDAINDSVSSGRLYFALSYLYENVQYLRNVWKVSNTQVRITKRNGQYTDLACAPIEIYGLK